MIKNNFVEVNNIEEISRYSSNQLLKRIEIFDGNFRVHKEEKNMLKQRIVDLNRQIISNETKLNRQKQLPYLVATVVEILNDLSEEDKGNESFQYKVSEIKESAIVIKTASRQTIFLQVPGLVPFEEMKPGDLVGVNKDSFLILEKLPPEFDSRAKSMELDERPDVNFNDIGGLNKQIQELTEAIILPLEHPEMFQNIGIEAPKGVLLYGPPGTGKTLLARAVANACNACFLKLAGPQLVQMYIGEGAKIVRDAFEIAKRKKPSIVFIDELDAIGVKRGGSGKGGREVQRTMLELLNQLDGFTTINQVKVIAATNRPDILDPALVRSGRIDRKIECPLPNESSRKRILKLHAMRMIYDKEGVNFDELARMTQDFNGAQMKAISVEAGMIALRRESKQLEHEDFVEGVAQVRSKKKTDLNYYA